MCVGYACVSSGVQRGQRHWVFCSRSLRQLKLFDLGAGTGTQIPCSLYSVLLTPVAALHPLFSLIKTSSQAWPDGTHLRMLRWEDYCESRLVWVLKGDPVPKEQRHKLTTKTQGLAKFNNSHLWSSILRLWAKELRAEDQHRLQNETLSPNKKKNELVVVVPCL